MTTITGKDSPLETTHQKITTALAGFGLELITVSELNPVEHCFSAHLQEKTIAPLCTNGKGTCRLASQVSGMAEFMERLATDFFFADYFLGSRKDAADRSTFNCFPDELNFHFEENETVADLVARHAEAPFLNKELLDFYNETGDLEPSDLVDNNFDSEKPSICALPFVRNRDNKKVYFPVSVLNNLYVSNGMAAGNSECECQAQALSEIVERYVKNIVIGKGLCLPQIPNDFLAQLPHLTTIKTEIEKHNFTVHVCDSSLGGKYPVICVILIDGANGGVYAAFGANIRMETAIERTLTELLQGRQLDNLRSFSLPVYNLELVSDQYNLENHFIDSDGLLSWTMFRDTPDYDFCPWSFTGNTEAERNHLISVITDQGFDIYLREYTHCGFYVCRILVPGMSEIYPADDLVYNNSNRGAKLRPYLLNMTKMDEETLTDLFELLEVNGFDDQQLISHLSGIIFDENSCWKSLRIGELKAHILLALGRIAEALEWCRWCIDYAGLSHERNKIFQAVATIIEFRMRGSELDYRTSLGKFFSEKEITQALSVIEARTTFFGLKSGSTWSKISQSHAQLLRLYNRINLAKASNYE